MTTKTFRTTIVRDGSMCFIPIEFDPRAVFGKVRAPVKVTLRGYTLRSTIAKMGDTTCIRFRKSNRGRRLQTAVRDIAARPARKKAK